MPDLALRSLTEVVDLVSRRELPPGQLTLAVLDRIDRFDGVLNAYATVFREDLLAQAAEADAAWRAGRALAPLHGVPIAVKDNLAVAGFPTAMGSPFTSEHVPGQDATVVSRLRAAGAHLVGKNTMHEWGMGGTSVGGHGVVRNPWRVAHTPGGSSGGSAVAVATGMAYAAIATDGMGSIRSPASFCGVVGFKPSAGVISRYGVLPPSTSPLDQVGVIARRVRDIPTVLRLIGGHDPRDPTSRPAREADPAGMAASGLRIGLVTGALLDDVVPEVQSAVDEAAGTLEHLGYVVEPLELPELDDVPLALHGASYESQTYLVPTALERAELFVDTDVRMRILAAELVLDADARRARQFRSVLRNRLLERFGSVDLLLLPTTPVPAFGADRTTVAVGSTGSRHLDLPRQRKRLTTRLTVPWNILGAPAVSMPVGRLADGLPLGIQLVAAPAHDGRLLRVAAALEEAFGDYLAPPSYGAGEAAPPNGRNGQPMMTEREVQQ